MSGDHRRHPAGNVRIVPFSAGLAGEVIEMILWSQNVELGVPITIDQQPDLRDIPGSYQRGAGNFWVAIDGDRVVGSIALADLGQGRGALRKMLVRPEYRGAAHGTAAALLQTLLDWSRANGIETIYLATVDALRAAHRFYEKKGFVMVSKEGLPAGFSAMDVDTRFYRLDVTRE